MRFLLEAVKESKINSAKFCIFTDSLILVNNFFQLRFGGRTDKGVSNKFVQTVKHTNAKIRYTSGNYITSADS